MWTCCGGRHRRRHEQNEQYDEKGRLPIHNAALANDIVLLKRELDQKSEQAGYVDIESRIVPSWASYASGKTKGFPIPVYERSPLVFAVLGGSHEAIKLLISRGASLDRVDDRGNTPLHWSCMFPAGSVT